jgi:hypothetical protein
MLVLPKISGVTTSYHFFAFQPSAFFLVCLLAIQKLLAQPAGHSITSTALAIGARYDLTSKAYTYINDCTV